MKKKIAMLILIIVVVISVIFINMKASDNKSEESKIDNENEYIITTNMKWKTMQNDGGSHINIYYLIDFNESKVIKYEDKYIGFKGYEYEGKILYSKEMNELEKSELKSILENATNNEEEEEKLNYDYYLISSRNDKTIKIYNYNVINRIEELLEQ